MEATQRTGLVALIGAIAPMAWGTTYLVTTQLLPAGHPMTASVLRAAPAGLLLIAITRSWPRQWGRLALLALLNIGAFFPLLFIAAYRLPGGMAAVVGTAQPFVAAAAGWILFRQVTSARRFLWPSVAVLGVGTAMLTGTTSLDLIGVISATTGTAIMAVGLTLTRRWGATQGLSGLASTGWQLLLGGLMIIPLIPLIDRGPWVVDTRAVLGYTWLSLVGGALAYAAWFHAARRLPATSTALLGPVTPVTAAILGWVVLGQSFTLVQGLGFAVALAASVLGQVVGVSNRGSTPPVDGSPAGSVGGAPSGTDDGQGEQSGDDASPGTPPHGDPTSTSDAVTTLVTSR